MYIYNHGDCSATMSIISAHNSFIPESIKHNAQLHNLYHLQGELKKVTP